MGLAWGRVVAHWEPASLTGWLPAASDLDGSQETCQATGRHRVTVDPVGPLLALLDLGTLTLGDAQPGCLLCIPLCHTQQRLAVCTEHQVYLLV